jgi:dephospho-CoA kinase
VVGLTGGLASGKSTVAENFQSLNVPVIDADSIARDVVARGEPALEEIRAYFGPQVIKSSGELDRAQLREHVFADPQELQKLEQILHPRIYGSIIKDLEQLFTPYAILMIPLLLESKQKYPVDRILVVDIPRDLQLSRASVRDGSDSKTLNAILDAQINRTERLAAADDVINNTGHIADLKSQVSELHRKYLDLAKHSPESPRLQATPEQ